jgi:hypothetical protein
MMPDNERKIIEKALNEKNYEAFIRLYKKYSILGINQGYFSEEFQTWFPILYLPVTAAVYEDNNDYVDEINILFKENFEKITAQESECG